MPTNLTSNVRTVLFAGAAIAMSTGCVAVEASPEYESSHHGLTARSQNIEPVKEQVIVAQYFPSSPDTAPVRVIENYDELEPNYATLASCPSDGRVAFSVSGSGHVSAGNDTLLGYATTYTNIGGGWTAGGGTFIAPCSGIYTFTVSFVKDAFYYNGTTDDVYVYIMKNGVSAGHALSGEETGMRGTGTHTVVLPLAQGDYVQTYTYSDNSYTRHLALYQFSGVLVHP